MSDLPQEALATVRRPRRAYFLLGQTADGHFHGYPHQAIVVAEGLKALGWQIASDVAAWRADPESPFLFAGETKGVRAEDCDLIVVSEDFFMLQGSPALPEVLTRCSVPAVFLDRRDLSESLQDLYSEPFRRFAAIFRTHGNARFRYPANLRHMVFGISDRIGAATSQAVVQSEAAPRSGILWNFRHKRFPHTVRVWAEKRVRPLLEARLPFDNEVDAEEQDNQYSTLMLHQTEGRHFPAYYRRMTSAHMAACFGGWFLVPVPQKEAGAICMWGRRLMKTTGMTSSLIAQWDSWRLWEAFAAGTTVLHVDMERNGFLFGGPAPEAMKHYIAVDLKSPEKHLAALLNDPERIRSIGEAGRLWATEHYTSKPIATRILAELGM